MPLSLTARAPAGICSARAREVSRVTSKVERLRLLIPMRSAPESMADWSSGRLWTSTRALRRRGVDGKVRAQDGQGYGGAGGLKMGQAALEERLVGEHAEGGGSAGLVGAGDAGGIEILHEDALTGRRLLDLGDDDGRTGGERGAEIAAGGEAEFGGALPGCKRWYRAREIFALFGDNTGQDVWNSVDQGCRSNGIRGSRTQRGDEGTLRQAPRGRRRSRIDRKSVV